MPPRHPLLGPMLTRVGLPRPDWDAVVARWESLPPEQRPTTWTEIERAWQHALVAAWGDPFRVIEQGSRLLTTDLPGPEADRVMNFIAHALATVDHLLSHIGVETPPNVGIGTDSPGFDIVIACRHVEQYLEYISDEHPEEYEGGISCGVCLYRGAIHVAAHGSELPALRATLAHELAHTRLAHLPLPGWLNEAVVVQLENAVTTDHAFAIYPEIIELHRAHWNPQRLEAFFRGYAFDDPRDGFALAYSLANAIADNLLKLDRKTFGRFILTASDEDGGAAACRELYGCELVDLVPAFARSG